MNGSHNPRPLPRLADVAPTQRPVQHNIHRLADVAPRERPTQHRQPAGRPPYYDYGHLQQSLDNANRTIHEWNQWYETVKPMLYNTSVETAYGQKTSSTDSTIRMLQQELTIKKWDSAEQCKKWNKEISSLVRSRDHWKQKAKQLEEQLSQKDAEIQRFKEDLPKKDSEISILKESLQKQSEEANNIGNFNKEEFVTMTASWEVEKALLSAFSQLKQDESLQKLKQLEEKLSQKNAEILTLKNEELSQRDSEISFLKESLQKKSEEANNTENIHREEFITMTASWEVEKAILSASSQLKQDESLQKLKQLEEKLQKNAEILTLKSEELSQRDSEISFLKESLQKQSEEANKMECLWKEQCSYMTATWEAEKASLLASSKEMLEELRSQRDTQILELRENHSKIQQQYEELRDELAKKEENWKVTIKQLKDEKDILNDALWINKEDLSKIEMEFSNLLTTKEAHLRQSEKSWQTKYGALEEQRTKELAEKQQSLEARVRQLEEEKNTLHELHSKKVEKTGRRFWSHKKKVKSQTQLEEAGESDKEKKKEKKLKEKEEKKTVFWSWKHKKDSNSKVEETAVCSVNAGQQ